MTTLKTYSRIPVRCISAADLPDLIASKRREVEEYEQRYELASEKMAELVDYESIIPTIHVIKWYHAYAELKFLLKEIPTIGTPGTNTSRSVPDPPR